MLNPLLEYHKIVDENPSKFCNEIKQMIAIQKDMLKLYDFIEEKGYKVIEWIEKFCVLPEGERAGEEVKLMLWQKWFLMSVFSFWGHFEEEEYDTAGKAIGKRKKYLRVVNDIMMVIASGNAKTTFLGFINTYLLFSKYYSAAKTYIGSNAQQQSLLCYNATHQIITKNKEMKRCARLVPSLHTIEVPKKTAC